ncbi:MAG: HAMP domain-containing histidine kinase [Clostridia bacterium]|nr:HAMP domain-containing histidine kinase [Clostridia bacterium]
MNVALIFTLLFGLALATVSYLTIDIVSMAIIESVYSSEDAAKERAKGYAASLQKYVNDNGVTVQNAEAFTTWVEETKYVYLMVYNDDQLLFDSATAPGFEELEIYVEEHDMHLIQTADGEQLVVSLVDMSKNFYYNIFNIIKLVAGVVALFAVMIVYVQRVTARISKLAGEVGLVSGGDTARQINMPGHDEITELSHSVEQMRVSILNKIESERAAIEANSELITSMSHDIRTPLTVLLGYLDMMKDKAQGDEVMTEYVAASEKTAMRLKRLSDDLFNYFLLFGKSTKELKLEQYPFGILVEQMLAEYTLILIEREYKLNVVIDPSSANVEITTDPDMFLRILENLISNMLKYADKEHEITIAVDASDGIGKLTFTNVIDRSGNKVETNGIGLKSCRKIAETLGIELDFGEDGDVYVTRIAFPSLPVSDKEDA